LLEKGKEHKLWRNGICFIISSPEMEYPDDYHTSLFLGCPGGGYIPDEHTAFPMWHMGNNPQEHAK
jgi:hypothetical protein